MLVTLEYAISSLAAAECLRQQGQMLPSAVWHWMEQNKPQKWVGRCSTSATPQSVWERQPPPHMCTTNRGGHIFPHIQMEPWMLWAERTSREKGQSWEQLFLQHSTFCSMGFSAGNLNSCFSLGKSAISPSEAALAAGQALHWGTQRGQEGSCRGELCVSGRWVRHVSEVIVNLAFPSWEADLTSWPINYPHNPHHCNAWIP